MPKYKRGSGSIYKKRGWFYIGYYENGKQVTKAAKTKDRIKARDFLRDELKDAAEGRSLGLKADRTTFDDLAGLVIADYKTNGKKSLADAERRFRKHLTPFFGGKRAREVRAADVQVYITKRQGDGATNGGINRELTLLKRAFNLGLQAELLIKRPTIRMLKENNVRRGYFEAREYEALLAKLPDYLRAPVTFGYWTGWRIKSEVLPLAWDQVDLEEGTVRLWAGTSKNGEGRVVALPVELRAVLDQRWAEHRAHHADCPWVFHREGERIKNFRHAWNKACSDAGLAEKIPHDFRRTAARNMVRAGIPERVVMQLLGHKTRSMLDRYNIVSEGDLREAATRLEAMMRRTNAVSTTISTTQSTGDEEDLEVTH
jgi:integrase